VVKKLRRKTLPIILLLALAIASIAHIHQIQMSEAKLATPILRIVNAYNITQLGMTFNVNITITEVSNLFMWGVDLEWNASTIKVTTGDSQGIKLVWGGQYVYFNVYEGPFMQEVRETSFVCSKINNTGGKISHLGASYTSFGSSASGSGLLATMNFTCLSVGETTIEIVDSMLVSNEQHPIDHQCVNGTVTDQLPPVSPIWEQLWFQVTVVVIVVIAVVPVVAKVFYVRHKKKIAEHPPEREEDIEQLL